MISSTDRAALHAASLEFLKSQEGLVYLQELYKAVELPPTHLFDMRNEYLRSFQNAEVCVANLWMINSAVTGGGEFSGAALLVCGGQGSEESEKFVEYVCKRMSDEDWQGVSRLSVATIQRELADDVYRWGNCRTLPLDFTDNYPVHFFDTIVGRDSIYLAWIDDHQAKVPCLVNPRSEAKAFAIPRVVLERCGVSLPLPGIDDLESSFQSDFAKGSVPGLYEEDQFRAVATLTSQQPGAAAAMLAAFWEGMAESAGKAVEAGEFEVTAFKEAEHLVAVIEFPPPKEVGDVYCAAAVVGPVGDGSQAAIAAADFTYYVLEKTSEASQISVREGRDYEPVSNEMGPDLGLFVEWVVGALGGDTRVRRTESGSEAMAAGIQMARETVMAQIEPFLAGEREDFLIKVAITDVHEQTEHMWLAGVSYENGTFAGHITEAPHTLEGFVEGQRFRLPPGDISDWMFMSEGKMYGNYTLRAMLPTMPEAEARKYREILAD